MDEQNLWPEFNFQPSRHPKTILKEQASFLMKRTNNILSAEVYTLNTKYPKNEEISHSFIIMAPALNNYKYELLTVRHTIFSYPLDLIASGEAFEANDESEFMEVLRLVFNNPNTLKIINSLISQSIVD